MTNAALAQILCAFFLGAALGLFLMHMAARPSAKSPPTVASVFRRTSGCSDCKMRHPETGACCGVYRKKTTNLLAAVEANLHHGNWAVIAPDGRAWEFLVFNVLVNDLRTEILVADSKCLDSIGRQYGLGRAPGESDEIFRKRIWETLLSLPTKD